MKIRDKIKKKLITSLTTSAKKVTDIELILNEITRYYKNQYSDTKSNVDSYDYLKRIEIQNTPTENDADICEGLVTSSEIDTTINSMQLNKNPGSSGVTVVLSQIFVKKPQKTLTDSSF